MQMYKIEMNENNNGLFSPRQAIFPPHEGRTHCVRTKGDYSFYNLTEFQGYNVVILFQATVLKAIA